MKQNKVTLGILVGAVAVVTAGAVFANSDAGKFKVQLGARSTYEYIKTDFYLSQDPTIAPFSDHGDSSFALSDTAGVFTSPSGEGNHLGWDHDDTDGFQLVNEGVFGIEDTTKEDTTNYRTYIFKITINCVGDRTITNIGTNTYLKLTAYYYNSWGQSASKSCTVIPTTTTPDDYSSIQFNISTYSSDYNYQTFDSTDIYKIVIDEISVQYICYVNE